MTDYNNIDLIKDHISKNAKQKYYLNHNLLFLEWLYNSLKSGNLPYLKLTEMQHLVNYFIKKYDRNENIYNLIDNLSLNEQRVLTCNVPINEIEFIQELRFKLLQCIVVGIAYSKNNSLYENMLRADAFCEECNIMFNVNLKIPSLSEINNSEKNQILSLYKIRKNINSIK